MANISLAEGVLYVHESVFKSDIFRQFVDYNNQYSYHYGFGCIDIDNAEYDRLTDGSRSEYLMCDFDAQGRWTFESTLKQMFTPKWDSDPRWQDFIDSFKDMARNLKIESNQPIFEIEFTDEIEDEEGLVHNIGHFNENLEYHTEESYIE